MLRWRGLKDGVPAMPAVLLKDVVGPDWIYSSVTFIFTSSSHSFLLSFYSSLLGYVHWWHISEVTAKWIFHCNHLKNICCLLFKTLRASNSLSCCRTSLLWWYCSYYIQLLILSFYIPLFNYLLGKTHRSRCHLNKINQSYSSNTHFVTFKIHQEQSQCTAFIATTIGILPISYILC